MTAAPPATPAHVAAAAVAAADLDIRPDAADPWAALAGYAHFQPLARTVALSHDGGEIAARLTVAANGNARVEMDGASVVTPAAGGRLATARWPGHVTVFAGAASHTFALHDPFADADAAAAGGDALRAPMPGLVKLVRVAAGEAVTKGQPLLVLEAMKMEHTIAAPHDGVIGEIVPEGAQVTDGAVLVRFEE
jgi:3-methylcrotonyl-CoA carboxylase alpha subunit